MSVKATLLVLFLLLNSDIHNIYKKKSNALEYFSMIYNKKTLNYKQKI